MDNRLHNGERDLGTPGLDENRFEAIRKAARDRRIKADTDGARRRALQLAEDNKLL